MGHWPSEPYLLYVLTPVDTILSVAQMTCLAGMALIYPFVKLGRVPLDLGTLVGAQAFPQPWGKAKTGTKLFSMVHCKRTGEIEYKAGLL